MTGALHEYQRHFLMLLMHQLIPRVLREVLDKHFSGKQNIYFLSNTFKFLQKTCGVCVRYGRSYRTHTTQVQNYAAKQQPSTRQNICEPLRVISVKHISVFPDDGSHKIRNLSE